MPARRGWDIGRLHAFQDSEPPMGSNPPNNPPNLSLVQPSEWTPTPPRCPAGSRTGESGVHAAQAVHERAEWALHCGWGGVGCTRCNHAAVEGVGHAFAQASMQAMSATWPKSIFVVCCEWCRAAPRLRASCCPQRWPTSRGPPRPIRTWSTGCFGLHATSAHSAVGGRRDLPRRWSQQVWVAAFTADRAPSKRQTLPHRWR